MPAMNAKYLKRQYLNTTSISAGQVLGQLAASDSPEARAMHKLVTEGERAVIDASAAYDQCFSLAQMATEQGAQAVGVRSAYLKASVQIAAADGLGSVSAYASLDRSNDSKFIEHLVAVFGPRDAFGKSLAARLHSIGHSADQAETKRLEAVDQRDRAERELAASVMRLRAAIQTARSVLHLHGVVVNRGGQRKRRRAAPAALSVVPQPASRSETVVA